MTDGAVSTDPAPGVSVSFDLACRRPWLVATFPRPHRLVSWSLNRPGIVVAERVAWLEVQNEELVHVDDPALWLCGRLAEKGLGDAVGLITARNVACYEHAFAIADDIRADCVITLGLNNGEAVGRRLDAPLHPLNAGTINILAAVSAPLSDAALLEMSSIATQARTAGLLRFGYRRPEMEGIVTGTGTDCIVAAAPVSGDPLSFAGMHTAVGEAVGRAVLEATAAAAEAWFDGRRGS